MRLFKKRSKKTPEQIYALYTAQVVEARANRARLIERVRAEIRSRMSTANTHFMNAVNTSERSSLIIGSIDMFIYDSLSISDISRAYREALKDFITEECARYENAKDRAQEILTAIFEDPRERTLQSLLA